MKDNRYLFITWDGPQVSYLDGLFIPIFKRLAEKGHRFHVLQFTWGSTERVEAQRSACAAAGIPYRAIRIWRRPAGIGPFATALYGAKHIRRAVNDWKIDTLMPRSLMPALATLTMRSHRGLRFIFDADGFAADERVDFGGLSPRSLTYRILRDVEAQMLRLADVVIVRSSAAIPILVARAGAGTESSKFMVVSNGRDPASYIRSSELSLSNRHAQSDCGRGLKLCYVGSVGMKYCPATILSVAVALKQKIPKLTFLVLTGDPCNILTEIDRMKMQDRSWISIQHVPADQVGPMLMDCDLGMAFVEPKFSTQAVAAIKLGEYLLAGLPIVGTAAAGDVDELIRQDVFFPSDGQNTEEITRWVLEHVIPARKDLRDQCRYLGQRFFSIDQSVTQYMNALEVLPTYPTLDRKGDTS